MNTSRRTQRRIFALGAVAVFIAIVAMSWFSSGHQQARHNRALIAGARAGDLTAVGSALDAGANVNARDADGITALMHAARGEQPNIADPAPTDHPEVIELLIQRGADVNAKTDSGFVALFWAARYGHARAAKVLIDHGADINSKDRDGMSALRWAATNQQTNIVNLLKGSGAKE